MTPPLETPTPGLLTIPIDIDLVKHCIGELLCTHGCVAAGVDGPDGLEERRRSESTRPNWASVVGVEAARAPLAPNGSGQQSWDRTV